MPRRFQTFSLCRTRPPPTRSSPLPPSLLILPWEKNQVHSFDLVSPNARVTACDMANVPIKDASVHVAVFCLSLMGTNLADFLREAHRVLVPGGLVKVRRRMYACMYSHTVHHSVARMERGRVFS